MPRSKLEIPKTEKKIQKLFGTRRVSNYVSQAAIIKKNGPKEWRWRKMLTSTNHILLIYWVNLGWKEQQLTAYGDWHVESKEE